jgi:hypothetical protein
MKLELCGRSKKPEKREHISAVELGYNVMKWTEYFVSLEPRINNVMINCEELIGTTEYLTV